MVVLIVLLSACANNNAALPQFAVDSRPAYHVVTTGPEGVKTHVSHDGMQWMNFAHDNLSRLDCYDITVSPDGTRQFLVYDHVADNGAHTLNVLQGTGSRHWQSEAAHMDIDGDEKCSQPQMRHLRDSLYGIVWLYGDSLYSAIYDAKRKIGDNLYLNKPVHSDWFQLLEISSLSFVYHNNAMYVVWLPNSLDRIMTLSGNLQGHKVSFTEPEHHMENISSLSNVISDEDRLYVMVVTGSRKNMLMSSSDGVYWRSGPTCYNIRNFPILVPFLFKDSDGEKYYLKYKDYWGYVTQLQNTANCEVREFNLPGDVKRVTYYPGLPSVQ